MKSWIMNNHGSVGLKNGQRLYYSTGDIVECDEDLSSLGELLKEKKEEPKEVKKRGRKKKEEAVLPEGERAVE